MPKHITDWAIQNNQTVPAPRLRINRTAALPLTTSWQRINFDGTAPFNINSFPPNTVAYNTTTRLLTFNSTVDQNYTLQFYYHLTSTLGAGQFPLSVSFRGVIPAPTPIYLPFPEGRGYMDLDIMSSNYGSYLNITLFASTQIRQYGFGLEMKTNRTPISLASGVVLLSGSL